MKRCLIVSGGWPGHRPAEAGMRTRDLLVPHGYDVTLAESLATYDSEDLAGYDLIVPNWTAGEIGVETAKKLCAAVAGGVGLGGFHGGMADAFRTSERFQFMVGGQYVAEPGGVRRYRVEIADRDDPITRGLEDFDYVSEQYYLHVDPAIHVLAVSRFDASVHPWIDGVAMPAAWRKPFGRGRVFVSALGHVPEEFDHPSMRTILERGLIWATRGAD